MKAITKTVEKTITEEQTIYVASDGTEFKSVRSCELYEEDLARKLALNREDVEINERLNNVFPVTASLPNYDYTYIWVRPRSVDAVIALREAYKSEYADKTEFQLDQWTCIELDYDENVDLYSEARIKSDVQNQFSALGIHVRFDYAQ